MLRKSIWWQTMRRWVCGDLGRLLGAMQPIKGRSTTHQSLAEAKLMLAEREHSLLLPRFFVQSLGNPDIIPRTRKTQAGYIL